MNRRMRYAAAGAGVAALVGVAGTGIVVAQSGSGTSPDRAFLLDNPAAPTNDYIAQLAKNLGITEQQLRDALKKTEIDRVDKAVADGVLSRERGEAIKKQIADGNGVFGIHDFRNVDGPKNKVPGAVPNGPGRPGPGFGPGFDIVGPIMGLGDLKLLADFLGITPDQLQTELNSGKTPAEVAAAHGKNRDQLKQFLTDRYNERLQKGVTDGKLTADQAKTLKESFATKLDGFLDAKIHIETGKGNGAFGFEWRGPGGGIFRGGPAPQPGGQAPKTNPNQPSTKPGAAPSGQTY